MTDVLILGGGLAGLAAAAALGESGFDVTVLETKPFAGGRATSYPAPATEDEEAATIDNCQHILLRCCVNLLAFYRRLGVADHITFHRDFFFLEPGGRTSVLKAGLLPAPLHFSGSFAALHFLSLADKLAIARALLALRSERRTRRDLDAITMLDWLREQRQTPAAIRRFWQQVLVSAINEDLDRMSAQHGFQVFWLGFLAASDAYEMGLPNVPLGELYGTAAWQRLPNVRLLFRTPVTRARLAGGIVEGVEAGGNFMTARHYISALPFERVAALESLAPALDVDFTQFEHVPITGIHLWFDRPVTELPYGTLLDRTLQWFFNKDGFDAHEPRRDHRTSLAGAGRVPARRARGQAGPGARHQRGSRDLLRASRLGAIPPRSDNAHRQSHAGRRLDALGLAIDHGGRSPQRPHRGGARIWRSRPAWPVPGSGHRVNRWA
jgi:zeta-carotene desaturase